MCLICRLIVLIVGGSPGSVALQARSRSRPPRPVPALRPVPPSRPVLHPARASEWWGRKKTVVRLFFAAIGYVGELGEGGLWIALCHAETGWILGGGEAGAWDVELCPCAGGRGARGSSARGTWGPRAVPNFFDGGLGGRGRAMGVVAPHGGTGTLWYGGRWAVIHHVNNYRSSTL